MKRQNEQIKGNVSTQDKGCFFLTMDFENLTHFLSKGCLRAWPGGTSQQLTAAQACSLVIRFHKNDRIRIRILFGFPKMTEYEYEYYLAYYLDSQKYIAGKSQTNANSAVLHAYHSSEHLNTHNREHFHKCEQCDLAFLKKF